ncbi:hypothetical protein HF283_05660 [Acidithiobacillus ferrooxidans]|uniref:hypothetical protein n=1 Tax=Acidithiobacillus ferridurans TaxID=1232575 RepID=UPI001C078DD6|nr:hypothetical protein [Acidithiobacillus ferridurans]MBU2805645.1 hypothetical protein [Acidithiobacillus ferridurans]MBU2823598.1 hypothetical protein [Acidithiobacillus ferrooxidans]
MFASFLSENGAGTLALHSMRKDGQFCLSEQVTWPLLGGAYMDLFAFHAPVNRLPAALVTSTGVHQMVSGVPGLRQVWERVGASVDVEIQQ